MSEPVPVLPLSEMSDFTKVMTLAEAAEMRAREAADKARQARIRAEEAQARLTAVRQAAALAEQEMPSNVVSIAGTADTQAIEAAAEVPGDPVVHNRRRNTIERRSSIRRKDPQLGHRRATHGRRVADIPEMPSGVVRLADTLRAQREARDADRRKNRRAGKVRTPGIVIDPVANETGLFAPKTLPKRKPITLKLVMLLGFMAFFALYANGKFPQFDQWLASLQQATQAKNDLVVGAFVNHWHAASYIACGATIAWIIFVVVQNRRATQAS